jgi:TRAP-type C4-dicarboxylate transport system permease small subunit
MNPLTNVLPERMRKVAYAVLFVLALAFAAWQAAQGDWTAFVGGLITALFGATAASNTATSSDEP